MSTQGVVDMELLDSIATYLGKQPYNDVARFVDKLQLTQPIDVNAVQKQINDFNEEIGQLTEALKDAEYKDQASKELLAATIADNNKTVKELKAAKKTSGDGSGSTKPAAVKGK